MTPQRILRSLRAQATNFYKDCDGGIARSHRDTTKSKTSHNQIQNLHDDEQLH